MRSFIYEALPGRIVFGVGASREKLADEVDRLDARRVLLLATQRERTLAEELAQPLGDRLVGLFTEVRPHVPVEVAEKAREAARKAGADCLLSIGGGSTTGTAKAIALETALPIVALPTTYAGSEMTPVWGLTEARRKTTGRSLEVLPKVVVYDPELTLSLPPFITGPSAMNAMAHCVEAFYAPKVNPITSLMAEEGIRALSRGVPVAVESPDDLEGRTETLYGAYLAGASFAVAGSGLHHKICHVLGGAYDLPHADMHAVVLPHAVAYNQPAIPEVMERVARALGEIGERGAALGFYDLAIKLGAPTALKDIGLKEENLDEAVSLVLEEAPEDNPRPVDEGGIRAILEGAYWGRRPEECHGRREGGLSGTFREGGAVDQPANTAASGARNLADEDLTRAVLASFGDSKSERFRQVMQSLVRHLHAFVSEVELTEEEWFKGIDFLTRTGHITDDERQEFILLSDVLGVSMLVVGINHRYPADATEFGEAVEVVGGATDRHPTGATEATVFGPFFVEGSPRYNNGDDLANGAPGEPCFMQGRVLSITGEPIPQAHIEVWQADAEGFYDVQYEELSEARGRGHLYSDEEGRYWFWSVKPEAYPIPHDGPVGELLSAANRSPMRPAHVHFMIEAPGYETLITHVFAEDDPHLDSDAVFGVKSSLIARFERHEPGGTAPDGKEMEVPFYTMNYDFVLAPSEEK